MSDSKAVYTPFETASFAYCQTRQPDNKFAYQLQQDIALVARSFPIATIIQLQLECVFFSLCPIPTGALFQRSALVSPSCAGL